MRPLRDWPDARDHSRAGRARPAPDAASRGLIGPSPRELVPTVPRSTIASFDLRGATPTCPLSVSLCDGTVPGIEVPRAYKGRAEKIAALLPKAA